MSRALQAQVLVSRRDDGSFVVLDALEREHLARDARDLGELLVRLVHDPDLPEPVVTSSTQVLVEEGLTKIVRNAGTVPDELAVAAGRVGAAVGTRAMTAAAEAAKDLWTSLRQKRAENRTKKTEAKKKERKPSSAMPRPAAKKNGVRRPSSLRFQEDT